MPLLRDRQAALLRRSNRARGRLIESYHHTATIASLVRRGFLTFDGRVAKTTTLGREMLHQHTHHEFHNWLDELRETARLRRNSI